MFNNLSHNCLIAYHKQFPKGDCGFDDPSGKVGITDPKNDTYYLQPDGETDESFMDRLERSKKAERNLFYKEWKPFEYEQGCDY